MNHHFNTIEAVAFRIMVRNISFIRNLIIAMLVIVLVKVNNQTGSRADNFAIIFNAKLPLRKKSNMAFQLLYFPRRHIRKAYLLKLDNFCKILPFNLTQDDLLLKFG